MKLYFLLVRIAALLGHRKARLLVAGQAQTLAYLQSKDEEERKQVESLRGCIWVHAASVGEAEQARPIIEKLRKQQPHKRIVLTFFSPSGYEMRKNDKQVNKVLYLPFATNRNAAVFLDALQPQMAIFVKYEFWKPYLKALHDRQIPTYLISAIFRPKQLFFLPWGKGYLRLLTYFTCLYVQDEPSRQLLARYGITEVKVAGDTRFDRVKAIAKQAKKIPEMEAFIMPQAMQQPRPVIVAGSTWPKDEQLLARYMEEREDVQLVLVPHEVNEEHLRLIFQYFEGRYVRLTEATKHSLMVNRILVVDTMGWLSKIYKYATVAYVGGGFGVGIHNTLEPAVWGIPIAFGPNYRHFREAKGLIQAGVAQSVSNYQEFKEAMDDMLLHHEEMGQKAAAYVQSELGATDAIYADLFS